MFLRHFLIAALASAPLMASPADAAAQERGSARAAVPAAAEHSAEKRVKEPLPPGIQRVFAGRELPPGLRNRAPEAVPAPIAAPEPEPAPAPAPEPTCDTHMDWVLMVIVDCNGNPVQGPGME